MEKTLAAKIKEAQKGNREVLNDLVKQNNGLIWSIVKRFEGRGYEAEDIYQIGAIGLIKAIKKFDFSYNVELSTYAVSYIIGEIKRFMRDDGIVKVSRQIKEIANKAYKIKSDYEKMGKQINVEEIAKELKISKEEAVVAMESIRDVESLYDKEDEDGLCFLDRIKSDEDEEEKTIIKLALKECIKKLDKREQEIIFLRYYKCQTQKDVAKTIGISQVQVCRIEKNILNNIYKELKEA